MVPLELAQPLLRLLNQSNRAWVQRISGLIGIYSCYLAWSLFYLIILPIKSALNIVEFHTLRNKAVIVIKKTANNTQRAEEFQKESEVANNRTNADNVTPPDQQLRFKDHQPPHSSLPALFQTNDYGPHYYSETILLWCFYLIG